MHKKQIDGKTMSRWAKPNSANAAVAGANSQGEGRYVAEIMAHSKARGIFLEARDCRVGVARRLRPGGAVVTSAHGE